MRITYDTLFALEFFKQQGAPLTLNGSMKGLVFFKQEEPVLCVMYEDWSKTSVWMHVAAVPGRHWLNRKFLWYAFHYPFVECGVERIFGQVPASNTEARRFDEHLGFKQVATIPKAAADGGDILIYCLEKDDCRYIGKEFSRAFLPDSQTDVPGA